MSMCRIFSCVVGRGCLLWPVHSLGKTLLAFAQLHFGFQDQICFTPGISWLPTFAFQSPMMKGHLFWVLVLEGLVGHHRIVQLQHYWLGHRLGLLWYWMICLEMTAVHGVAKSRTQLSDFTFTHWRRKWQPTPVFLPGESQGRGSLVGCRLWGCTESDMTEAT